MKRILLTTTSLVLAAGVAQAEVTFSGKAEAGVSRTAKVQLATLVAGCLTTSQATQRTAAAVQARYSNSDVVSMAWRLTTRQRWHTGSVEQRSAAAQKRSQLRELCNRRS